MSERHMKVTAQAAACIALLTQLDPDELAAIAGLICEVLAEGAKLAMEQAAASESVRVPSEAEQEAAADAAADAIRKAGGMH